MRKQVTRWLFLSLIALSWSGLLATSIRAGGVSSFTFSAVGDFSNTGKTTNNLRAMNGSLSSFVLALGDLSYGKPGAEQSWCNYVHSLVSPTVPFELVSGNHEDGGESQNGLIDNFASCLPDKLGVSGIYGKEYFFDYPAANPLARFIMIGPALTFTYGNGTYPNGSFWNYSSTSMTAHYLWLSNAIDQARALSVPWVIVGMHKVCLSSGVMGCEINADVMNLLLSKRVDLILQGHEHSYQRSKQLACGTRLAYTVSCVVNDGTAGMFTKGQGSVIVIDGTGGVGLDELNSTAVDRPYFASVNNNTYGFSMYNVTPDRLDQMFMPTTGNFTDSFSIVKSLNPVSASITGPASGNSPVNSSVNFVASASGGLQPYGYAWSYGDGGIGNSNPGLHSYRLPGTYIVGLTVNDSMGQLAQAFVSVLVCAPVVTTISAVLGSQAGLNGGATYDGGGFKPGITNKRDPAPPCTVNGNSMLVQLDNVRILNTPTTGMDCASFWNGRFCDTSFSVADAEYLSDTTCPVCYLHRIEVEIDQSWGSQGNAPAFPNTTIIGSRTISIVGFVYWDPQHTTEMWHAFSGWELHPVVSWRITSGITTLSAGFNVSDSGPFVGASVTFNGGAAGGVRPYLYGWNFGDGTGARGNVTSHVFTVPGVYAVSLRVTDASGQVMTVFKMVTVPQPDFGMSMGQNGITLFPGSSMNVTVVLTGLAGFGGNVSLSVSLSPAGGNDLALSWSGRMVLVQNGMASSVVLRVDAVNNAAVGVYALTLSASSGIISHTSLVNVYVVFPAGGGGGRPPLEQ